VSVSEETLTAVATAAVTSVTAVVVACINSKLPPDETAKFTALLEGELKKVFQAMADVADDDA
jgi:uncharacterized protein (DUF2267 family)